MSVDTLCQVCGTAPARFACGQCGAMVCSDHYDEARGACRECARSGGRQL